MTGSSLFSTGSDSRRPGIDVIVTPEGQKVARKQEVAYFQQELTLEDQEYLFSTE